MIFRFRPPVESMNISVLSNSDENKSSSLPSANVPVDQSMCLSAPMRHIVSNQNLWPMATTQEILLFSIIFFFFKGRHQAVSVTASTTNRCTASQFHIHYLICLLSVGLGTSSAERGHRNDNGPQKRRRLQWLAAKPRARPQHRDPQVHGCTF